MHAERLTRLGILKDQIPGPRRRKVRPVGHVKAPRLEAVRLEDFLVADDDAADLLGDAGVRPAETVQPLLDVLRGS